MPHFMGDRANFNEADMKLLKESVAAAVAEAVAPLVAQIGDLCAKLEQGASEPKNDKSAD